MGLVNRQGTFGGVYRWEARTLAPCNSVRLDSVLSFVVYFLIRSVGRDTRNLWLSFEGWA